MSKAQKLVNRALEILQGASTFAGLNDQKKLVALRTLFDNSPLDGGYGTATNRVIRTKEALQKHHDFELNDQQAITAITHILEGTKAPSLRGKK